MLVCSVSQRARRRAIAADLAETAAALDASTTGTVVFATLVDDPANVLDAIDAYLGEIMLEAATAADTADGVIPAVYAVTVNETASAASAQDGTTGLTPDSWSTTDKSNITLSNSNLTATATAISTLGGVRSNIGKSTGKYYFEFTLNQFHTGGPNNPGVGLVNGTQGLTSISTNYVVLEKAGNCYINGVSPFGLGTRSNGDIIGIAVDFTNSLVWIRVAPSGNWNNSGTANPATGTGGASISAMSGVSLFAWFQLGNPASADAVTANFGGSAFSGTVPSGFNSGWGN